jgi:hypothetical protein
LFKNKKELMTFEEERCLKEKVKDIVFVEMHKPSYLKELNELDAINSEEKLRVLEHIFKAFEVLSDEELYFALTEQFWNAGPREAIEVVRMVLARRMKKWNMRLLLQANREKCYLGSTAEKIITERTLQKYKNSEEELKKAAAAKNRLISLPAKIALEISSNRKSKIEYMRKALKLGPS